MRFSAAILLSMIVLTTVAVAQTGPATQPSTQPASRPARLPLGSKSDYEYTPPQNMTGPHVQDDGNIAVYVSEHDAGQIAILLHPSETANTKIGKAIIEMLKEKNKRDARKMLVEPRIEKDPRFSLRVHQRYELSGHTFEEVHLYRELKGKTFRVVEVGIICDLGNAEYAEAVLAAGEDVTSSITPKGEKPPKPIAKKKPATRPTTRSATKPAG